MKRTLAEETAIEATWLASDERDPQVTSDSRLPITVSHEVSETGYTASSATIRIGPRIIPPVGPTRLGDVEMELPEPSSVVNLHGSQGG